MSYAGYNSGSNPYDQRGATSPQNGGYASPGYNAPTMGRDEYAGQNVEMAPLAQNGSQFGSQQGPTKAALDKCTSINDALNEIERESLPALKNAQQASLNSADPGRANAALEQDSLDIMRVYKALVNDARQLKSNPQSASLAPVGQVDRRLKAAIKSFQNVDLEYKKKSKDQMARQYRIVRPDATEDEVRQAVEDPSQQVFSQALMQSDRRGQSQSAMNAVRSRHEEIQKIEGQIIELAELFEQMDELVVQQEVAVTNIEMKGEEVVEHMDKGNEQISTAIVSAQNARKWKWWCLGIVVLIIAIIVIIVLIYKFVVNGGNKGKRWILPEIESRMVTGSASIVERTADVPGLAWTRDNTLVAKGEEWAGQARKMRAFQA